MSNLKGTETLKNLMAAFAGESQARNRYTFWSSIAKKEGYVEVSKIFEETANQEKEHAKRLMKLMNTAAQGETLPTVLLHGMNVLVHKAPLHKFCLFLIILLFLQDLFLFLPFPLQENYNEEQMYALLQ